MSKSAVTDEGPAIANPAGIEAVYLAHRENLTRFLRARGAGVAADDIVQELWLRIGSASKGPVGEPLRYLYSAANNLMLNFHRANVRGVARDAAWGEAHLVGKESGADVRIAARQEIERARARLAECGDRVQHIYILFRVEGMNQRAIAHHLGVSLSTVEKDIRRAYRALAALRVEGDHVRGDGA